MWKTESVSFLALFFVIILSAKANPTSYPTSEHDLYDEESRRTYTSQRAFDPAQQAYYMFRNFMRNTPGFYFPYGSSPPTNFIPGFGQGYGGNGVPDFRQYIPQPPNIPTTNGGTAYSYVQPGGGGAQVSVRASPGGKPVFKSVTSRDGNSYGTAFAYST